MESVDCLTPEVVRLLGDVRGKRILELGIAQDCVSPTLAAQGASPVLVEESAEKVLRLKRNEQLNELRFEVRQGKLADLAFCPAESIDIAFSVIALAGTADLARVFRQLQRVLRVQGALIFGLIHPLAFLKYQLLSADEPISYRSKALVDANKLTCSFPVPLPEKVRSVSFGEAFSQLKRTGFSIDQMPEIPQESSDAGPDPTILLFRARK
ncbi:MAG: methyltransferase domain-containing protein [Actinomycetota bacterium]|nr:methyltransferase domain-containing protein [Actinomycetota bacterium]